MKDFAKSIKVNNKTVMDDKGKFIWGYVEKEGDKYVAYTHGITGAKTQLLKADDEKTATEELKDYCRTYWNKVGNSKACNAYSWREKNGHQELYNPNVPFGGHTRGYVEKGKNGYVGAKTNGSIVISKKEFESEEEAKKYVENSKVENANKTFSGKYLDIYDNGIVVAKDGWAFGERFNENEFGRWIDEQIRAKEKTLQECKQMKREFESNY